MRSVCPEYGYVMNTRKLNASAYQENGEKILISMPIEHYCGKNYLFELKYHEIIVVEADFHSLRKAFLN